MTQKVRAFEDEKSAAEADDQSTAIASKTVGAQVDSLLGQASGTADQGPSRSIRSGLLLGQLEGLTEPTGQSCVGYPQRPH